MKIRGANVEEMMARPELWKCEILPLFYKYIKYGMFPELVNEEKEEIARKYIVDNVVDRIIYKDLPEEFKIKDLELLKNIVYLLGKNPGMLINYKEIAKNLGRDQRTVSNYFEYLEFGLLTRFVFNYRGSPLASLRKLKKVYFTTPNLLFALNPDLNAVWPIMLENLVLFKTNARFFYRNGYEVDFILIDSGGLTAIEVKSKGNEVSQLKKFSRKFGKKVKKNMLISFEQESKENGIQIIPAWKLLLFH